MKTKAQRNQLIQHQEFAYSSSDNVSQPHFRSRNRSRKKTGKSTEAGGQKSTPQKANLPSVWSTWSREIPSASPIVNKAKSMAAERSVKTSSVSIKNKKSAPAKLASNDSPLSTTPEKRRRSKSTNNQVEKSGKLCSTRKNVDESDKKARSKSRNNDRGHQKQPSSTKKAERVTNDNSPKPLNSLDKANVIAQENTKHSKKSKRSQEEKAKNVMKTTIVKKVGTKKSSDRTLDNIPSLAEDFVANGAGKSQKSVNRNALKSNTVLEKITEQVHWTEPCKSNQHAPQTGELLPSEKRNDNVDLFQSPISDKRNFAIQCDPNNEETANSVVFEQKLSSIEQTVLGIQNTISNLTTLVGNLMSEQQLKNLEDIHNSLQNDKLSSFNNDNGINGNVFDAQHDSSIRNLFDTQEVLPTSSKIMTVDTSNFLLHAEPIEYFDIIFNGDSEDSGENVSGTKLIELTESQAVMLESEINKQPKSMSENAEFSGDKRKDPVSEVPRELPEEMPVEVSETLPDEISLENTKSANRLQQSVSIPFATGSSPSMEPDTVDDLCYPVDSNEDIDSGMQHLPAGLETSEVLPNGSSSDTYVDNNHEVKTTSSFKDTYDMSHGGTLELLRSKLNLVKPGATVVGYEKLSETNDNESVTNFSPEKKVDMGDSNKSDLRQFTSEKESTTSVGKELAPLFLVNDQLNVEHDTEDVSTRVVLEGVIANSQPPLSSKKFDEASFTDNSETSFLYSDEIQLPKHSLKKKRTFKSKLAKIFGINKKGNTPKKDKRHKYNTSSNLDIDLLFEQLPPPTRVNQTSNQYKSKAKTSDGKFSASSIPQFSPPPPPPLKSSKLSLRNIIGNRRKTSKTSYLSETEHKTAIQEQLTSLLEEC